MSKGKALLILILMIGMVSLSASEIKDFDGFEDGDYTNNPKWHQLNNGGAANPIR